MSKTRVQQIAISLALMLYTGFRTTGVDNAAHVAGAAAGFILCLILYHGNKKEEYHGNKKEELQYDEYYDRIL